MHGLADESQGSFEIAVGGAKGVGVNGERGTQYDQRSPVGRAFHRLFQGEASDGLNRYRYGIDDFAELVEGIWHSIAPGGDSPAFVISDMVDDEVATEILESSGRRHHIRSGQIISHDLDPEIPSRLDHTFDCLFVRAFHYHHMSGSCPGHHFGFEIAAVHRFQIRHNGDTGEALPESPHPAKSLGEDEGGSGFQPVDPGAQGNSRRFECFTEIGKIQGNLDDRFHGATREDCRGEHKPSARF